MLKKLLPTLKPVPTKWLPKLTQLLLKLKQTSKAKPLKKLLLTKLTSFVNG